MSKPYTKFNPCWGKRIRKYLTLQSKSVYELASYLDIWPQTIYKWLDGSQAISGKHCDKICKFFNQEITLKDIRPDLLTTKGKANVKK